MRSDLLLLLADHLRNSVNPAEFSMESWEATVRDWRGFPCGTVGCAARHAAQMLEFQVLGLRIGANGEPCRRADNMPPASGYVALAELFDIDLGAAKQLFTVGPGNRSLLQVVENLRHFAETGEFL